MTQKLTKPFILATCGRGTAERYEAQSDIDVISMYTPGAGCADLQSGWGNVTFVGMNDDDEIPSNKEINRIVDAALNAIRNKNGLLVHCEMGMSRSVAVAYAISDFFGIPYRNRFTGNAVIRKAVMNELHNRWIDNETIQHAYNARV